MTREVVEARLGSVDDEFVATCHEATGGDPLYLRELLREVESAGVAPTAANAGRAADAAPRHLARLVNERMARLPAAASRVAAAVAVRGTAVWVRTAAALAGLDVKTAGQAADALAAAGVFAPGLPLDFSHPIVRNALYAELPAYARASEHGRAARLLAGDGAPDHAVAAHLLLSELAHDERVVERLRAAAWSARGRGATEQEVDDLRRAVTEPPADRDGAEALLELADAELRMADIGVAEVNARAALSAARDPETHGRAVLLLGRTLTIRGPRLEVVDLLESALAAQPDPHSDVALALAAELLSALCLEPTTRPRGLARVDESAARVNSGSRPAERRCWRTSPRRASSPAAGRRRRSYSAGARSPGARCAPGRARSHRGSSWRSTR